MSSSPTPPPSLLNVLGAVARAARDKADQFADSIEAKQNAAFQLSDDEKAALAAQAKPAAVTEPAATAEPVVQPDPQPAAMPEPALSDVLAGVAQRIDQACRDAQKRAAQQARRAAVTGATNAAKGVANSVSAGAAAGVHAVADTGKAAGSRIAREATEHPDKIKIAAGAVAVGAVATAVVGAPLVLAGGAVAAIALLGRKDDDGPGAAA